MRRISLEAEEPKIFTPRGPLQKSSAYISQPTYYLTPCSLDAYTVIVDNTTFMKKR